jgi:exonuclease SbcD
LSQHVRPTAIEAETTVKIIHTSDWHLGRTFGALSLAADQAAFVDWFVELVRSEEADLVVIAGDLYDRAIAPTHVIELFRDAVKRLRSTGAVVAAITGNHDGADRVAPYAELLDLSGFYLRGGYERLGEVIRHDFADGPLDLVLLPYLDPQAATDDFGIVADSGAEPAEEDADLVQRRLRRTHQSVLENAIAMAEQRRSAPRSVAIAHVFVSGGTTSESERVLVVGGTGEVSASLFSSFSYTALGHLHRPQDVGSPTLRYSGTPLAYSFSEEHPKSVTVIDMDPDGATTIAEIPVSVGRSVRTLTGTIDELLDPTRHPDAHSCIVRAVVTDRETVLDAKARLAQIYRHVVEVQLRPLAEGVSPNGAPVNIGELSPITATREFWKAAEGNPPDAETDQLLIDAVTAATSEEA